MKPGTKLEDNWGHPIRYELADTATDDPSAKSSAKYKLYSVGPDGQPDTADDIKLVEENADGTAGTSTTSD